MADPNFHRTVVLILRHGDDGSMGLVLNRPLELSVKEACEQALVSPCNVEGPLHQGGPCEGPLMVLHSDAVSGGMEATMGVYLTTDKDDVERLLADAEVPVKCFLGYAGWGAGQLEDELSEGAWLTTPAAGDHIFGADARIWSKLMTIITLGKEIDPSRIPDDPTVN
jgi:putative transcriptional regulator